MVSSNPTPPLAGTQATQKSRYFLTWRWHFYAGLFVVPFMLMLSITGLIMLFDDEIESARYGEVLSINPDAYSSQALLPISVQLKAVQQAYPEGTVTQFVPATSSDVANRFSVTMADESTQFVLVNPYTADITGTIDRSDSWYQLANDIHGTLLIGDVGDYLIEIAASLTVILLVSGIYLWLPNDNARRAGFLKIRTNSGTRTLLRDLHANIGGVLSIVLLFFVLSGLAWAGIWGAKIVQPWGSFPAQKWDDVPVSSLNHKSLNHGAEEEIPWNLELTPLPESKGNVHGEETASGSASGKGEKVGLVAQPIGIDRVVNEAKALGFTQYKLNFPRSESGVFTVSANTMSGDITDPTQDRTTHIDQYSGKVLADVTWRDYNTVAKAMAAGIALHQGDISIINKIANVLFCLAFILIAVTGAVMWWQRRPAGQRKLGAPPKAVDSGLWKVGVVSVVLVCVAFPMAGLTIVALMAMDALICRYMATFKDALS
ncbi:PepSY-associated TM helix domain-containing protein [Enterovibrio baiacu]|uniref:PepSY-associated TM helix domain-containing protein n=1 Tax=Enterovibrio baiacu TaxID=2491023 RepID=UPI001012C961|nr:PepSY domain-containing protein [Enterovibrio baiacu]MBE1277636.1 PepSY domain-containing protein [Enterovibrio baiacu]